MSFPWLSACIVVPVVGSAVVALLPKRDGSPLPKQVALGFSLLTLAIASLIAVDYDGAGPRFQLQEQADWIRAFGAHWALGVDGIGVTLLLLTAILTPVVIIASWNDAEPGSRHQPRWSVNAFFAWMLGLEALAIGVFEATDVFLFYVLFEATLIPIYFLIGGYGGVNRSYAAAKFLLYNLFGGLLMLAAVIGLYVVSSQQLGSSSYLFSDLSQLHLDPTTERWLFVGFFIAFAIKAPLFPVHTWLPDAAEGSGPGTAVLMVAVLDKIGAFGMLRFCLGLFPGASQWATPVVLVLAVISILYGAMAAIASKHIFRLIAYTSVSHFGLIILGIFVLNTYGGTGSTLYMFNHGLSTAALFLVTGFLITRRGSAMIPDFGGVEKRAPILAGIFLVAGLSTLSLPGLSPFVSEFLVLLGAFVNNWWYAVFAVIAIVLSAMYILWMYQRTMTGPIRPEVATMTDLNVREIVALAPVVALLVFFGFFPKPLTSIINPSVSATLQHVGVHDPTPPVPAPSAVTGAEQEAHQ
ncbi:MAG TPA: NADH-quinone oxidoreductase subunit M [Nocardioidaceae bacterium]|nr:NADH-quinone oxidoreductase subunit M [Nocardioidaceae bacterium]